MKETDESVVYTFGGEFDYILTSGDTAGDCTRIYVVTIRLHTARATKALSVPGFRIELFRHPSICDIFPWNLP